MDRRLFILTGIAGLASGAMPGAVLAESRAGEIRYNFGSAFSKQKKRRSNYGGKQVVSYRTREKPGTIVIDTRKRKLFFVMQGGKAMQYGVGVGRRGFQWSGTANVRRKEKWPGWHPPAEMIEREKRQTGRTLPEYMPGGPNNPLGARALYLFKGSKDTLYRIHGTNQPSTIGGAVSSGCIRMINEEVIDLFRRTRMGAKVIVL
ncbi:MAG: L,D-transpeptidase [Rhizobiales bacterium]|nr:L,D-transpeptidase [Hyphomicrobiales bacterium]